MQEERFWGAATECEALLAYVAAVDVARPSGEVCNAIAVLMGTAALRLDRPAACRTGSSRRAGVEASWSGYSIRTKHGRLPETTTSISIFRRIVACARSCSLRIKLGLLCWPGQSTRVRRPTALKMPSWSTGAA
jgi:hypothetical protein